MSNPIKGVERAAIRGHKIVDAQVFHGDHPGLCLDPRLRGEARELYDRQFRSATHSRLEPLGLVQRPLSCATFVVKEGAIDPTRLGSMAALPASLPQISRYQTLDSIRQ
jgi:hypothetical protein